MSVPAFWGHPIEAIRSMNFIKTKNTGSGMVEVHSAVAGDGFGSIISAASSFSVADALLGTFQVTDNDAGSQNVQNSAMLHYIKTKQTGSGRVEVHSINQLGDMNKGEMFASFRNPMQHYASCFGVEGVPYGTYRMNSTDLVYIKTKNTSSGVVEVYIACRDSKLSAPCCVRRTDGILDDRCCEWAVFFHRGYVVLREDAWLWQRND